MANSHLTAESGYHYGLEEFNGYAKLRKADQGAVNAWESMRQTIQGAYISWFFTGDIDLLMERETRRLEAERKIRLFGRISQLPPSRTVRDRVNESVSSWGSDGSMIPATANPLENKTITAATSGPISVAVLVTGRNNSILHGELMGLILDHVLSQSRKGPQELFSDHLNSVRITQDAKSVGGIEARLRRLPGRSYYRWIIHIQKLSPHLKLEYTPGHSRKETIPAILNSEADSYATSAQKRANQLPIAPIPTFFMDEYTFHTPDDGWIESEIKSFVNASLIKAKVQELGRGRHHRMATWLYDQRPPPSFIYTHAVSAYSAAVQLYARSGQLATANGLCQKKMLAHDLCRLGCMAIETPHHIFVECPNFQAFRDETAKEVVRVTERALESVKKELREFPGLRDAAESFLTDCSITWPLTLTQFYLGHIPPLERYVHRASFSSTVVRDRVMRNIHSAWHVAAVRLTGRIYGDFLRRISTKGPFAARIRH